MSFGSGLPAVDEHVVQLLVQVAEHAVDVRERLAVVVGALLTAIAPSEGMQVKVKSVRARGMVKRPTRGGG